MRSKKAIAILTTARSDFGLLKSVIWNASLRFDVDVLVSGSHFLVSRGSTINEIREELVKVSSVRIVALDAMEESCSPADQIKTLAGIQIKASDWFAKNFYDLLLFLGDRWELWGVTLPAFLYGIPLAHISGGEVTEGVIDENVRHAHTKMSGLHFVAAKEYARNISLMGEEDWRIAVVGECGLDLIHNSEIASVADVMSRFGVNLDRETILVTFHPSTLDYQNSAQYQIDSVLVALECFSDYQIVFTAPGIEQGSEVVLSAIRKFVADHNNSILVDHFGSRHYLTVMSMSKVVVGNSSSGLVEASSFGIPAINVGNRQKNRLSAESVQHVPYHSEAIKVAITQALSIEYQAFAHTCLNPYDPYRDGKNSLRIIQAVERALLTCSREQLRLKKFENDLRSKDWNTLLKQD